jgi:hypothetical protein
MRLLNWTCMCGIFQKDSVGESAKREAGAMVAGAMTADAGLSALMASNSKSL